MKDNTTLQYNWLAKFFHWFTFLILIIQIPLGFILVRLDFSDLRITIENIHVIAGITVFYLTIFRLIFKFFSQSPKLMPAAFVGQKLIAKLNHIFLYLYHLITFQKIIINYVFLYLYHSIIILNFVILNGNFKYISIFFFIFLRVSPGKPIIKYTQTSIF